MRPASISQRLALVAALLLGILLAPAVWTLLPATGPALAQASSLSIVLVPSASSMRPGDVVSVSIGVRTSSPTLRLITAQLAVTGPANLTSAAFPGGMCTLAGTVATCELSISTEAPGAITAQLQANARASGAFTLRAIAQGDGDTAPEQAVAVQVVGEPLPSATATATATTTTTPTTGAAAATSTPAPPRATATPEAMATPMRPGDGPDMCEPNDTLVQPCALPSETEVGDLSFAEGSIDVYSLLLKGGRTYTIRAASTEGIDPALTVYLAGALDTPIANNDDAAVGDSAAVVQVMTASDAWYIVQVANKAPGVMRGKRYTLSARSSASAGGATAPSAATAQPTAISPGDALENNYSPDTAPRLGWGVPYDLSLVCPQPDGCVAGDHDFFWVPVKAGIDLVAVTYDLGPGADTLATFYRPDPTQQDAQIGPLGWRPVVANDDTAPGWSLRSALALQPDWSGYALLVIAPSERDDPPAIPETAGPAGRYRLIVGSPEMAAVQSVLRAQTDGPPITPTTPPPVPPTSQPVAPVVAPSTAADSREVIKEESLTGSALVIADDTPFYRAVPPSEGDLLARYPKDAQVLLLGQTYAGYVKVQPSDSVAPGWMFAPALRPLAVAADRSPTPEGASGGDTPIAGDADASQTQSTATAPPLPELTVERLDPAPLPTTAAVGPQARSLAVELCASKSDDPHSCATPLANLAVEVLLHATQQVVASARTDRSGRVTLSVSVPPNALLELRIAALGVSVKVEPSATALPIRVPPQTNGGSQP